ncbi:hypothetical protein PTKIN_Ptkin01aG0369300 [Pterospermum kingtungense]
MRGFFSRRFLFRRSQTLGRGLRSGFARRPRVNRLVRRSPNALSLAAREIQERSRRIREELNLMIAADFLTDRWINDAATEIQERNRRIREALDLLIAADFFTDLWINDCLVELENDPLMRNALQRIEAQDLEERNNINVNSSSSASPGRQRRR